MSSVSKAALARLRGDVHVFPQPGGGDVARHGQRPPLEAERAGVHLHGELDGEVERHGALGAAERLLHRPGRAAVALRPVEQHVEAHGVLPAVLGLPDAALRQGVALVRQPRRAAAAIPQRGRLVRVDRREEEVVGHVVLLRRVGVDGEVVDDEARRVRPQHDGGQRGGGAEEQRGGEDRAERAQGARGARAALPAAAAAAALRAVPLGEVGVLGRRDAVYLVLLDVDDVRVARLVRARGDGVERGAEGGGDGAGGGGGVGRGGWHERGEGPPLRHGRDDEAGRGGGAGRGEERGGGGRRIRRGRVARGRFGGKRGPPVRANGTRF